VANSFSIKFEGGKELTGMAERIQSAIRPAAQAGAQVLYEEARARVNVSDEAHIFVGTSKKPYTFQAGSLKNAIYQVFSKDNSTAERAVYHVAWNHDNKSPNSVPYGFMVEFGYLMTRKRYKGKNGKWYTSKEKLDTPRRVPARPFLGPANDARGQYAVEAASAKFNSIVLDRAQS
jgi:hypothetical protein